MRFVAKSLTLIASRMIPKNFLSTYTVPFPSTLSIHETFFRTMYTRIMFSAIAIIMFTIEYSALRESMVVSAPAPAIRGKIRGTIVGLPPGESL